MNGCEVCRGIAYRESGRVRVSQLSRFVASHFIPPPPPPPLTIAAKDAWGRTMLRGDRQACVCTDRAQASVPSKTLLRVKAQRGCPSRDGCVDQSAMSRVVVGVGGRQVVTGSGWRISFSGLTG